MFQTFEPLEAKSSSRDRRTGLPRPFWLALRRVIGLNPVSSQGLGNFS
jgi:hypothetical protein